MLNDHRAHPRFHGSISNKFEGEKRDSFSHDHYSVLYNEFSHFWNIFPMPFILCVDSRLIMMMQFLMFSFCFFSGYKLDGWPRSPTQTST